MKKFYLKSTKALLVSVLFVFGLLCNSNTIIAKNCTFQGQLGESLINDIVTSENPGFHRVGPINTAAKGPDLIYKLPDGSFEIHEVKRRYGWAGMQELETTVKSRPADQLSNDWIENFIDKEMNKPNSKFPQKDLQELREALKNRRVKRIFDEVNWKTNQFRQTEVEPNGTSGVAFKKSVRPVTSLDDFENNLSADTRNLRRIVNSFEQPSSNGTKPPFYTNDKYNKLAKKEQVDSFSKLHNKSITTRTKGIRYQSPKLAEYKATHGKELFSKNAKTIASKPIKQSVIKAASVNPNFVRTIENATKPASLAGKAGKAITPMSKGLETVGIRAPYISRAVKGVRLADKGEELTNVVRAARLAEGAGDAAAQFGKVMEVGGMVVGIAGAVIDISFSAYKIYETNVAYSNYELDSDIYVWKMIVEGIQLRAGVYILLCTISPDPFSKVAVWIFVGESIVAAIIDDWLTQIQEQRHRNICRMMKFANYRMRHDCIAEVLRRMAVEI